MDFPVAIYHLGNIARCEIVRQQIRVEPFGVKVGPCSFSDSFALMENKEE